MRKTLTLGKINFCGKRKVNLVTVDIALTDDNVFTASAMVYNSKCTDIISGGQCLDHINEYKEDFKDIETWDKIYRMWKLYHLNDVRAGSKKQRHVVRLLRTIAGISDYNVHVKFLKKHGLYIHEGREYGTKWYKDEIPQEDLEKIHELLEG